MEHYRPTSTAIHIKVETVTSAGLQAILRKKAIEIIDCYDTT